MFSQAGHLRTEQGEYWIEPSNQITTDSSEGRPHVIFRRTAVDKVEAFHRIKRDLDNRDSQNVNTQNTHSKRQNHSQNDGIHRQNINRRRSREDADRRRREFLEKRKKRLEAMRRNPIEYRRRQATLRMEARRHSASKSNSVEPSKSLELSIERQRNRNRNKNVSKNNNDRLTRIGPKRRKKRSKRKNCATKQPPYQWRAKNKEEQRILRFNQVSKQKH